MPRISQGNLKDISHPLGVETTWKSESEKKLKQNFKLNSMGFLQIHCNVNLKDQHECQQAVGDHGRKDHQLSL